MNLGEILEHDCHRHLLVVYFCKRGDEELLLFVVVTVGLTFHFHYCIFISKSSAELNWIKLCLYGVNSSADKRKEGEGAKERHTRKDKLKSTVSIHTDPQMNPWIHLGLLCAVA